MSTDRGPQRTRGRRIPNEPDPPEGRPVPANLDAERSLLGAAMLSAEALEILATRTEPGDFYKPGHGHVAAVLRHHFDQGWPADSVTVADELSRRGLLEQIGGAGAIAEIMASTPATTNAARYATIVHDYATKRRLLAAAEEIRLVGFDGSDAHQAVLQAQELLGHVASQNGSRQFSTLDVADVAALLDTGLEPQEADFLRRNDGRALFYAGKMHVLQGEPSSGKTWLALQASLEVLALGGAVLYLDYEDTAVGVLGRLLAVGAEPGAVRTRFKYVQPAGAFGPTERVELDRTLAELNPDLVVIDGVAEALARDGFSEDRAAEVITWIERLPRWLARTGAAVVMLDHVVKDKEQQGRWQRGSGAKLGAVDGASYFVKVLVPFSRNRDGKLQLKIAKDRPGAVGAINDTAAVAYIEPKADGTRVLVRLERDTGEVRATDAWKPTVLMRKVSDELERSTTELTATALRSVIHSDKPKLVTEAISRLIIEGYVRESKRGRSTVLVLVKPYDGGESPPPLPEPPPDLFDGDPEPLPDNVTKGPWPEGEEEF